MFLTPTKWVEIFDATIQNNEENFQLKTELNKVEKDTILSLPNLNDTVKKKELPVHVILRVNDYAKVKMQERPRIGQPGNPIAELTQFGQFIMSPGHESNFSSIVFKYPCPGL